MSTSKILGQKDVIGSDRLQATISTAPGEEWYWRIGYISDAAYTNGQVSLEIQVTYDVIFMDREDLGRSLWQYFDAAYAHHCKLIKESEGKRPVNTIEFKDTGQRDVKKEEILFDRDPAKQERLPPISPFSTTLSSPTGTLSSSSQTQQTNPDKHTVPPSWVVIRPKALGS